MSGDVKLTPAAVRLLEKDATKDGGPLVWERQIQTALARAAARRGNLGDGVDDMTPVNAMLLAEALDEFHAGVERDAEEFGDDHSALFRQWWRRVFDFFFAEGPHPGLAVRRIYMLARRYCPEHILFMNGTDLALMFGETRAAQSYRLNLLFDGLKAAGVAGYRGGGAKAEGARSTYAARARGNHSRRSAGKSKRRKKNQP